MHVRVITAGRERWYHDVVRVSNRGGGYYTLMRADDFDIFYWEHHTSLFIAATAEDMHQQLRDEARQLREEIEVRLLCLPDGDHEDTPTHWHSVPVSALMPPYEWLGQPRHQERGFEASYGPWPASGGSRS